ncbi:DUF2846 domain-containing protein [Hydrocarboniclastica marina]|uniref:DUF2846 domain-containing protein n=1 Tax=Hydrocarboniclastica marina TaxID=2259620 RepID=A0A4P7XJ84_9ALTE|nr:DUF2846 domain-containing protein [Hydrocarboniclastica marina]QCF26412.1 DUF2846 domain-containing protein [Hydrocarboniclastica marina]
MVPVLRSLLLASVVLLFSGCGIHLHQSIGKSLGPFLHPVDGHDFVHTDRWDEENHAIFYFYRLPSQWASDEIESPSVYVDGVHYFNIRSPGFTWLEVYPGDRHIIIRRPLLGLEGFTTPHLSFDLSRIADAVVDAKAGNIYYFRYSEEEQPRAVHPDLPEDSSLRQGDLTLVPREVAIEEIYDSRFLKSDLLAPNHAAISIVEKNRETNYERARAELETEREEELAAMKEEGRYNAPPWYWPFGGSPSAPLEADRKIKALDKEREAYLADKAAAEEAAARAAEAAEGEGGGSWWWPF